MGGTKVLGGQRPNPGSATATGGLELGRERTAREAGFRRIVDQHLDRCYRLATVVLGDPSEAEDAVHDAFVTAWRKYDSLRDQERLEAWFDRIIVNTCRSRLRRARRTQVRDISTQPDIAVSDPTSAIADELVMRQALQTLKADDRVVLVLRFYQDLKVDDIAAVMGIRPRAASSRLHRALERLRDAVRQEAREAAP